MANRTLEIRLVRVTGGVTTVIGYVVGGQVLVADQQSETPGAGNHVYKLQARDNTAFYTGKVNGRVLTALVAKR